MFNGDWQIFFLSALPVTELRVSIPLAISLGMTPIRAYIFAVLGNILPVMPLLLLLDPFSALFCRIPAVDRIFKRVIERTRLKGKNVGKYGIWGLVLFVSIPFPGTGAWTGAILSWLLGIKILPAFLAICVGVCCAGILVTLASVGAIQLTLVYGLEYLLLAVVGGLLIYYMVRQKKKS